MNISEKVFRTHHLGIGQLNAPNRCITISPEYDQQYHI